MINFISTQTFSSTPKFKVNKNLITERKKISQKFSVFNPLFSQKFDNLPPIENEKINAEPEIWEIDFFSKPVLNESGKKLWELIIINNKGTFEHVESVPNNLINSKELRKRINFIIKSAKIKPVAIKFFRTQMFNMITIALSELELNVRPSRKTRLLFEKIKEREETVYKTMKGFKPFLREIDEVQILRKTPERMPDFLRGDSYIFATIDLASLKEVLEQKPRFLEVFQPSFSSQDNLTIPGLIIISNRAKSLSSWLNSVELFGVLGDVERKELIIECGLDTQYLFGKIKNDQFKESKIFQENKKKTDGLHFIAVQSNSINQEIIGFWLLK
jgi:hypothetical protein